MHFTKNNLLWDRLSYQNSVITFGEHYESLAGSQKELRFMSFMVDDEKHGRSKSRLGLQYLVHLNNYYQRFDTGLDMEDMTTFELELTNTEHWDLWGFGYYVLQCIRGLAEGPAGPYWQHREGVRYMHDFYMTLQMSEYYWQNSQVIPRCFPG